MKTHLSIYLTLLCFMQVSCDEDTIKDLSGRQIAAIGDKEFSNNFDLTNLNLSSNAINDISFTAFTSLVNLRYLDLSHNRLKELFFESYTLKKLTTLHAKNNSIGALQSLVFRNFKSLEDLDLSNNALTMIKFDIFKNSPSIKKIDLSHNFLENFDVNVTNILKVEYIDLSYNKITLKTGFEFSNLPALQYLYLNNNNMRMLPTESFNNTNAIKILDISWNPNLIIIDRALQNLKSLLELDIDHVKSDIIYLKSDFIIDKLSAHSCGIDNLQLTHLESLEKVRLLNLSNNDITAVNEHSFKNLHSLFSLDLSYNKITYIQPGSFLNLNKLNVLFLQGNQLSKLQFGVFGGIIRLVKLNLSNNSLYTLDIDMLPSVVILLLDDNRLSLNLEDFLNLFELMELSIGRNQISCKDLVEWKKLPMFMSIVQTPLSDYFIENVDGISCHSLYSEKFIAPFTEQVKTCDNTSYCSNALESLENKCMSEMKEVKDELKVIGKLLKSNMIINVKDNSSSTKPLPDSTFEDSTDP